MSVGNVMTRSQETGTEDGMFQRLLNAGLASKSFGERESCTGQFHLVEIPEDSAARAIMRETVFSNDDVEEEFMTDAKYFDALTAGWYFALLHYDGFVFHECETKEEAFRLFDKTVTNYEPFDIW